MILKRFHRRSEEQVIEQPVEQQVTPPDPNLDDDVEPDNDSPNNLEFFSNGAILRTMRANVNTASNAGPRTRTRRGIMLALDDRGDGLYRLDMHGKTLIQFFHDLHAGGL